MSVWAGCAMAMATSPGLSVLSDPKAHWWDHQRTICRLAPYQGGIIPLSKLPQTTPLSPSYPISFTLRVERFLCARSEKLIPLPSQPCTSWAAPSPLVQPRWNTVLSRNYNSFLLHVTSILTKPTCRTLPTVGIEKWRYTFTVSAGHSVRQLR
jgi:hypothetical protein